MFPFRLKHLLSLSILLYGVSAKAYFIDYFKAQYAGEIGVIAFGLGKNFTKKYSLEYFHGYVPKSIGGEEIETFSLKNNYRWFQFDFGEYFSNLYTGVNVYHVTGLKYQTSRHESFPQEYYRMGSLRGLFYWGMTLESLKNKYHMGYFEAGLNDIVLTNYYNNPDVIDPLEYVSLALGYGYKF